MRPQDFERMQPHEFEKLLDGYKWRQEQKRTEIERQDIVYAYFISMLLNVNLKKKDRVTVGDLLDPLYPGRKNSKKDNDEEALKAKFKDFLKKNKAAICR